MDYQEINAQTIDRWVHEGWEWGKPISHEAYLQAQAGQWNVWLTPVRPVPHEWLEPLSGKRILGLASGGGQQMPIFSALGAQCTVLDYSTQQLESERMVSAREGYDIRIIQADMTKPFPFEDGEFDMIFHPVSNCYVQRVEPIWKECYRVLRKGGVLLAGFDTPILFAFDDEQQHLINTLPFDPLKNEDHMEQLRLNDNGVQFSHTLEEQIGGQLAAGFSLTHLYDDLSGSGPFDLHGLPTFVATRAIKA